MPELPEVETTLNGIKPYIIKQKITSVIIRHYGLRWPIPRNLAKTITGQTITSMIRRGKYLLLATPLGTLIMHLGMSGSLSLFKESRQPRKHDHVDITFDNGYTLRFTDPRRFGAILWTTAASAEHILIKHLGPEPLSEDFTGAYLWHKAKKRKAPVKSFIMDSKIVVGVGNIYATEALFSAKIHPLRAAGELSLADYNRLTKAIQKVLVSAIEQGGTTLRDFSHGDGKKGYFSIRLKVYGRKGKPCLNCKTTLEETRLSQRSTVYCPKCQTRG